MFDYKSKLIHIFIFAIFINFFLYANSFAVGTIGVRPMSIDLVLKPAKKGEFQIDVCSTSSKDTPVHLSLFDAMQKEDGSLNFVQEGQSPYSAAGWIKLNKTDFIVRGGETVTVKGVITVPRGYSGSRVATIMVEPGYEKKATGVSIKVRYAVVLRVNIAGVAVREKAKIQELALVNEKGAPVIETFIANHCEINFNAEGDVVIRDENTRLVERVTLYSKSKEKNKDPVCRIYPGARVAFVGRPAMPLPPGSYTLSASMKYGRRGRLSAKHEFTVKEGEFDFAGMAPTGLNYLIEPSSIEAKIPAGGSKYNVISITNQEEEDINFKLKVADYEGAKEGKNSFSCADWISLGSAEFTIKPRRTHRVPVKIKVPAGVTGGRYARILAKASFAGGEAKNSSKIDVVLIMPGEENRLAGIKEFLYEPEAGKKQQLEVTLLNKGNIHLTPKCEVVISDIYRNLVEKVDLKSEDKIIVPECSGRMSGVVKRKLVPGEYTAVATVDYGGDEKATANLKFKVD